MTRRGMPDRSTRRLSEATQGWMGCKVKCERPRYDDITIQDIRDGDAIKSAQRIKDTSTYLTHP